MVNNSGEPLDDLARASGYPTRVLTPGANLGYARGVNEGIRAASEENVLLLNPDVRVLPGSIEALERAAEEHPRAGILAPKLLDPDGSLQLSARRFYSWRTLLLRRMPLPGVAARSREVRDHLMEDWDHADTRPVDWVLGAAMYVRRGAMRDVGLMDERYFLYFEDVDWCQRMWRHGYEVVYCADARMVHEYARASAQIRPRSVRAHAAGLLRFTEKWSAILYAMSQHRRRTIQVFTLVMDALAAVLACVVAYAIRSALDPWFDRPVFPAESYAGLLYFTVGVTIAALAMNGLYRRTDFTDRIERAFLIGQSVVQAVLLLMAATFLFQMPRFSRFLVLLVAPLLFLFLYVARGARGLTPRGLRAAPRAGSLERERAPRGRGRAHPLPRPGGARPDRLPRARAGGGAVPPRDGGGAPRFRRRALVGRLGRASRRGRGGIEAPGTARRRAPPRAQPRTLAARAEACERSLPLVPRRSLALGAHSHVSRGPG